MSTPQQSSKPVTPLAWRMATGALLLALIVAGSALLHGCGGSGSSDSAAVHEHDSNAMTPAEAVAAARPAEVVLPAIMPASGDASAQGEAALPPEIAIEPMNTLVVPGEAITVAVQGTPDVTQMMLSDGIGDPQALVRDASGDGTWSVDYRVPLRPREERYGLSVTAKNEAGRWRRVWLFLNVQSPATAAAPDSTAPADER